MNPALAAAKFVFVITFQQLIEQVSFYIRSLEEEVAAISVDRQTELRRISDFIRKKQLQDKPAKLVFICTHNSRRSQFGQVWAATAAHVYGIKEVQTFSGGTEVTAFNPRAVSAIKRAGFRVKNIDGKNPHYEVFFSNEAKPLICFSKKFDDPYNPAKDFIAIITCSDADQNCPVVPGASRRVYLPYNDPKEADGTPHEITVYDARCRQIAAEMMYVMSQV